MTATRARQCGRKKAHPDRDAAEKHHARLIRAGAHPSTHVVYRCPRCGAWHVGHRRHARRAA